MIACPAPVLLDQLLPAEPLLMMGAGPVPIPAAVAAANARVINHLGDTMRAVIVQLQAMARYVFQTTSPYVFGVAGPGSAAMEMAVCNLASPVDTVLSVCTGYFSSRMAAMALRAGSTVVDFHVPLGQDVCLESLRRALMRSRAKVLTIAHGETSNTTVISQLAEIADLAHEFDCLVIVDAVCTLSTMPLEMDAWGLDAVITGGQKGLSSIPGVSLVAFSRAGFDRICARVNPPAQWCLDARLANGFWNENRYHYTAPTSGILALYEALRLVCEETLEARFVRHQQSSESVQAWVEAMGLQLLIEKPHRLNSVLGVTVPAGVDGDWVRAYMSKVHAVEISGSFGLPIWRIGQMGEQCRRENVQRTMLALGDALARAAAAGLASPGRLCEAAHRLAA